MDYHHWEDGQIVNTAPKATDTGFLLWSCVLKILFNVTEWINSSKPTRIWIFWPVLNCLFTLFTTSIYVNGAAMESNSFCNLFWPWPFTWTNRSSSEVLWCKRLWSVNPMGEMGSTILGTLNIKIFYLFWVDCLGVNFRKMSSIQL